MTTTDRARTLRALVAMGEATPEEQRELREMEVAATPGRAARGRGTARPALAPAPPTRDGTQDDPEDTIYIELNTESFELGGGSNFQPPSGGEGTYPGRCIGTTIPGQADDQLWFNFEGTEEAWRGALVTAGLTKEGTGAGGSGAFKVKDVLIALDVPYELLEHGVQFSKAALLAGQCQVSWAYITTRAGERQLRIQNVFPLGEKIESL